MLSGSVWLSASHSLRGLVKGRRLASVCSGEYSAACSRSVGKGVSSAGSSVHAFGSLASASPRHANQTAHLVAENTKRHTAGFAAANLNLVSGGRVQQTQQRVVLEPARIRHFHQFEPGATEQTKPSVEAWTWPQPDEWLHWNDDNADDMPTPRGPPKFDFPLYALSLDVETTGTRLGVDKLISVGAAVMAAESQIAETVTLDTVRVDFKVNYPEDFEPRCLAQFWDQPPNGRTDTNPLSETLLPALQENALEANEAAQTFYAWWLRACQRFPGFYLVTDNPTLDVGMMDIALHQAALPNFHSLCTRPDGSLHLPVDMTSLACGFVPYGGTPGHYMAAGTRWARMHHVIPYETRNQCPYEYGRHDPLEDAKRNGWMFVESMKLVYRRGTRPPPGAGRGGYSSRRGGDFLSGPGRGAGPAGGFVR
ncbi:hypothetical protein NFJ02_04g115410 [Pycnococcus provasolii]